MIVFFLVAFPGHFKCFGRITLHPKFRGGYKKNEGGGTVGTLEIHIFRGGAGVIGRILITRRDPVTSDK